MKPLLALIWCTLAATVYCQGQEKITEFAIHSGYTENGLSTAYFSPQDNSYRVTLQHKTGSSAQFTRYFFDDNFALKHSYTFSSSSLSFSRSSRNKYYFLSELLAANNTYEIYSDGEFITLVQPSATGQSDKVIIDKKPAFNTANTRLLAVCPYNNGFVTIGVSSKADQLLVNRFTPGKDSSEQVSDMLPSSNITDKALSKKYPRDAQIKFKKALAHFSVKSLYDPSVLEREGAKMYYTERDAYLLLPMPYDLGLYILRVNLETGKLSGTNYFVNDPVDNTSTNERKHRNLSGAMVDSLLIIKNTSEEVLEYYFYDIYMGALIKKHTATAQTLDNLVHSPLHQKGTWGSAAEEKSSDRNKKYLRKGEYGTVFPASITADSLVFTSLAFIPTTGIWGTVADLVIPFEIQMMYSSTLLPPIGLRNKLIYFHSKFSRNGLLPSQSNSVETVLDKLIVDEPAGSATGKYTFMIRNKNRYFLGYFFEPGNKIAVYQYHGE